MFRLLCMVLSLSVSYASCSVRPEHKDNKYGTAAGCARDAWQNKVSCETYPMSKYCKWSEEGTSEEGTSEEGTGHTFILTDESPDN